MKEWVALAGASVVEGVELGSPDDWFSARSNEFGLPWIYPVQMWWEYVELDS